MLMRNATARWFLVEAYDMPYNRWGLKALPDWAKKTRYTIDAKPPEGFPRLPQAKNVRQIKLMLQAMLADRFKVAVHHETRETSAYEMTLAKGALKNMTTGDANQPPDGDFNASNDNVHLVGKNMPMSVFGDWIGELLGRPVSDKSGLKGVFNFDVLRRATAGTPASAGGCDVGCRSLIIGALSNQLGVKLRATTALADFLVLDHIGKPHPN
ncbi:MAG: TIGR03435 family protein [Terriglobales bacterium]